MRYRPAFLSASMIATAIVAIVFVMTFREAEAAYLENVPQVLIQPDGTRIECFASGDEHYHWLHDANGFVIVRNPEDGYWVWAEKSKGAVAPSKYVVGRIPPDLLGLEPRILPDRSILKSQRESLYSSLPPAQPAPTTGTIENIVIFIRFSGESEFTDAVSTYDNAFNSTGTSSMKAYFLEASYNQLTINSTLYPTPPGTTVISYQDSHVRSYFQPYDSSTNPGGYSTTDGGIEKRNREWTLLKGAVDAVSSQVPGTLNVDADGDGLVDNVVFFVKGYPDGWSDLLWPHRWVLWDQYAYINGARVYDYNLQLSEWLGVGVLCHEMFHSLGAPDLYHYSLDGIDPAGSWDLMNINSDPPQHMTAFMKKKYGGWISSIPEITTSGTYTLNPLTSSTNNAYKIASPNTTGEYFVVEYRRKIGTFENSVPGSGLIVYRINTEANINGNAYGPPDELYIYRPGGSATVRGAPDSAHFSLGTGRTQINDTTNPSSFLTDASNGGLDISDVGSAGATISFTATVGLPDDFGISVSPSSQEVCRGVNAQFAVTVSQIGAFTGPVTLSSSGKPVGTNTAFSPNPVTATPGSSTYTVSNTINASAGTSTITIGGNGTPGTHSDSVSLTLLSSPGTGSLVSPLNGAVNVAATPTFTWSTVAGASSYTIQIDKDPNFQSVDHSATVQSTSYSGATLNQDATYYWRIIAGNSCGVGSASSAFSLTTTTGSTVCTNVLLEPGFEGGSQVAWSEGSSNGWPLVDSSYPRTGIYSAWLGGGDSETSQLWQSAAVDATATSATLRYWYVIDSSDVCGYDDGGLLINGTPVGGHIYDLCTTTNTGGGWVQSATANLLSHAGTSPEIRFYAATDISESSSFFLDDVILEVCIPGTPSAIFANDFELGNTNAWSASVP